MKAKISFNYPVLALCLLYNKLEKCLLKWNKKLLKSMLDFSYGLFYYHLQAISSLFHVYSQSHANRRETNIKNRVIALHINNKYFRFLEKHSEIYGTLCFCIFKITMPWIINCHRCFLFLCGLFKLNTLKIVIFLVLCYLFRVK